jgi:hypothetical protein
MWTGAPIGWAEWPMSIHRTYFRSGGSASPRTSVANATANGLTCGFSIPKHTGKSGDTRRKAPLIGLYRFEPGNGAGSAT